ncbi:hypothetical protein E3N88_07949 [Mikania micrantha]|uniref:Uncharacterized protein n=1 Tax=Mikania micrantha TaxID=192012 RepID=A0A5N6PF04_9ASTR|nr:hypothetical protein E3N88_07949 [Mikania micrantha]
MMSEGTSAGIVTSAVGLVVTELLPTAEATVVRRFKREGRTAAVESRMSPPLNEVPVVTGEGEMPAVRALDREMQVVRRESDR